MQVPVSFYPQLGWVRAPDRVRGRLWRGRFRAWYEPDRLYALALTLFLGSHGGARVTEQMNAVVDAVGETPDLFRQAAARRVLDRVDW